MVKAEWGALYSACWHSRICEALRPEARRYSQLQASRIPSRIEEAQIADPVQITNRYHVGRRVT